MRSSAQPQTGSVFQSNLLRSPEPTNNVRRPASIDRYPVRQGTVSGYDFPPVDSQARYSISYVPGMSEHVVNTGKTLPEAQLKVVLLACEVERLNTLNYNFVKENEILKTKVKKSERENDLETKLAIVLAENEKLNQIVEELQNVYTHDRESYGNNQDYERRISELLLDLEEWKQKYQKLTVEQPGDQRLQIQIEELTRDREILKEQLGRQGRDLEALRVRLGQVQVGPADVKFLQEQVSILKGENEKYKTELDTMKLKYGNADALQQKLSQYDSKLRVLLTENDKLNSLLADKVRELANRDREASVREVNISRLNEEKTKSAGAATSNQLQVLILENNRYQEALDALTRENEALKRSLADSQNTSSASVGDLRSKLLRLTTENDRLNNLIAELSQQSGDSAASRRKIDQLTLQLNSLLDENRRLNDALNDKARVSEDLRGEIERLRKQLIDAGQGNVRVEALSLQINNLLEENRKLNEALADRLREIDTLRIRIRDVESSNVGNKDLRDKLHLLATENDRLNALVIELNRQAGDTSKHTSLQLQISQLTAQLNNLLEENKRLNVLANDRAAEADRSRKRASELEEGNVALVQLRDRLVVVTGETERLNSLALELRADNERLRKQLAESGLGNARIEQLTLQLNGLLEDNRKLNDLVVIRSQELDRINLLIVELRNENDKLKVLNTDTSKVQQLTIQLHTLLDENKRLNELIVERLRENEALRRRLTELEAGNALSADLREKLILLTTENERLNEALLQIRGENDKLRRQIVELGQGGVRIEQLTVQITGLLEENRRLNNLVAEKALEADKLRANVVHLNALTAELERANLLVQELGKENERLRGQVADGSLKSSRVDQLSSQMNVLLEENRRLNDIIAKQAAELENLKHGHSQLRVVAGELERQSVLNQELGKDNERLKKHAVEVGQGAARVDQLTFQINGLLEENRRLNDIVGQQAVELDRLKSSAAKITLLTSELDKLNLLVHELSKENERLRGQVAEGSLKNSRVDQLSGQLNGLLEENRRLNDLAVDRSKENENLRRRLAELQLGEAVIREHKEKLLILTTDIERLNNVILELRRENDQLKAYTIELRGGNAKIEQLTLQLNGLLQENKRLNDSLGLKLTENEELRRKLASQESNLSLSQTHLGELQRLSATLEDVRARCAALERENAQLGELHQRVLLVTGDNERLNAALIDRMREIDDYRRKYIELQNASASVEDLRKKLLLLTGENDRLNSIIQDKLKELDAARSRVFQLESSNQQLIALEERLRALAGERDNVSALLIERTREIDALKVKLSQLELGSGAVVELTHRLEILTRELDNLRRALIEKNTELDQLRVRVAQDQENRKRLEVLLVENERLNAMLAEKLRESDALRRRVTELEGGNVISGELNTRLTLLSTENLRLQQELDVLRVRLSQDRSMELKAQLDVVLGERDRYLAALNDKTRELDIRRSDVEQSKKARPVEHVRVDIHDDIIKRLEEQNKFLEEEVRRLNQIVVQRDIEVDNLKKNGLEANFIRQENERLNKIVADKLRELEEIRSKTPDSLAVSLRTGLEAEYKRLLDVQITELSGRFNEERQALAQRVRELESQLQNQAIQVQNLTLTGTQARQEADLWHQRHDQLEKQRALDSENLRTDYEKRIKESAMRRSQIDGGKPNVNADLEDKVAQLTSQNERSEENLKAAHAEVQTLRQRFHELEVTRAQEIQELRQQFDNSKKANIEVKEIQIKFNAERTAYETQILQLQQKVSDLESHVAVLSAELEKNNKLNVQRLAELEQSRRSTTEIRSSQTLEVTHLRAQIESYKANAFDVKQLAIKYSADKAADQSQIKQLKQLNENNKAEIEKLYELIEQRKVDFEALNRQNQELAGLLGELTKQAGGQSVQANQDAIAKYEQEITNLHASRDEFKKQAQRNSVELTRKNKELVDKLQELDILKMKYEEALANYQALNTRLFEKLSTYEK